MARRAKADPPELTEEAIEVICRTLRAGNHLETACAYAGLSPSTVIKWIRKGRSEDEASPLTLQLVAEVDKAMAEAESRNVALIAKAGADGIWRASAWLLERRFPERWGKMDRFVGEISGPGGAPIRYEAEAVRDELVRKFSRKPPKPEVGT